MDYVIEQMEAMKVIGFEKAMSYGTSYDTIPKYWQEVERKIFNGSQDETHKNMKVVFEECKVGEFGICVEGEAGSKEFSYLIAGRYDGREVPAGMQVFDIPAAEWARFRCVGPLPGSLQTINTKIFKEWLPGNPDFEIAMGINIEWYSEGDMDGQDYLSEIWIPVKRK